jgi:hypothetical protein
MCEGCIFEDLENLKVLQKQIGKDRILVLPSFSNNSRNRARLLYELADFNYRVISLTSLVIPTLEARGPLPYFAVINSQGNVEMVFFPRLGYSTFTQAYFKEVEKRLRK